jgi:glycosyltransferase involved in cell wall biosynthesis
MRLAFFLDNRGISARGWLPDPALGNPGIGGTEYAFLAVIRLLQDSPVEPLLFWTVPQPMDGVEGVVVPDLAAALEGAATAKALALVFRPLGLHEPDWIALERSSVPAVAWLHNLGCADQGRFEALPGLRWLLVSGAQLDAFRHSRLVRTATVIANPVAVPPGLREPRRWAEAKAANDLAYVGALTPFKGFDRLAAQWGSIARRCPTARLRVFGGADLYGPRAEHGALTDYEQWCRDLLSRSGCADRVVFEGCCGLERYGKFGEIAVGVVNPSGRDETFCLSAAEWSACGIPVVTARRHALVQTVLDGHTGLLADSDAQLADHCVALLQDPARAWQLGLAGQALVQERFSAERVRLAWVSWATALAAQKRLVPPAPSTPLLHEQRWLRQLWGALLVLPGWPSWPCLKQSIKRGLPGGSQALRPQGVALLVALVALLVWVLLVAGKFGGNPSGLARIGDQLPLTPRLQGQELVILEGKRGNDGQQFLSLALDPLQLDPATSAALDNPVYRGKRLLYPLVAWALGGGQPPGVLWSLGLVNVVCIAAAAGLVAQWAVLHQRSAQWGLAVLLLPGYWITLTLNTADLLATTLMLAAAVAWKQQQLRRLCGSLGAALLTRETAALAWLSSVWVAVQQRRWRWLPALALVPLPWLVWTSLLSQRFAVVKDQALARLHFSWPFAGILGKALQLAGLGASAGGAPQGLERCFDALSFSLWLGGLLLLARVVWQPSYGLWLRRTALLYGLVALCTSLQILNRFPDYTRVWIDLASLVLLAGVVRPHRAVRLYLCTALITSLGYGAGYALLTP